MNVRAERLGIGDEFLVGINRHRVTRVEEGDHGTLRIHTDKTQPARPLRYKPSEHVDRIKIAGKMAEEDPEPRIIVSMGDGQNPPTPADELRDRELARVREKPPAQVAAMTGIETPPAQTWGKPPESKNAAMAWEEPAEPERPKEQGAAKSSGPPPDPFDSPGHNFKLLDAPYLAVGYFAAGPLLYTKKGDERVLLAFLSHEQFMSMLDLFWGESHV